MDTSPLPFMKVPKGKRGKNAYVGLEDGADLPTAEDVRVFFERHWEGVTVGEPEREEGEQRIVVFAQGDSQVAATHFPWPIKKDWKGKPHGAHIFVTSFGVPNRVLLAHATAAMAMTSDSVFVLWPKGKHVVAPASFLRSALRAK